MTEAVRLTIANYPDGHRFHGNELHSDVISIYPEAKNMYPDTLMRMMRRFCKDQYITVDHNRSLYEKVSVKPFFDKLEELVPKETPPVQMDLFAV